MLSVRPGGLAACPLALSLAGCGTGGPDPTRGRDRGISSGARLRRRKAACDELSRETARELEREEVRARRPF